MLPHYAAARLCGRLSPSMTQAPEEISGTPTAMALDDEERGQEDGRRGHGAGWRRVNRGVRLRHVAEEQRTYRGRNERSVVDDRSTETVRSSSSVTRRANGGAENMDSTAPLATRFYEEH